MSDLEILAYSLLIKLVVYGVLIELSLILLRRLDRRIGFKWRDGLANVIGDNPLAIALYGGLRFAGVVVGGAIVLH